MASSDTLKGLTIEIGGDTTKLGAALTGVNGEIQNLQDNLRKVETALKLDPGNLDALRQKQQLLGDAIAATAQKLETLKEAQRQADETIAKGGEVNQTAYRNLQTEIVRTEASLNNYNGQLSDVRDTLNRVDSGTEAVEKSTGALENSLEDTTEATQDATDAAGKLSDGYTVAKNVIANFITDALRKLWDGMKDFAADMITSAAAVNAEWSAFDQVFGNYADNAELALNTVADTTGTVATRMLGTFTSLGARFTGLGADAQTGAGLASRALEAAADSAAFWDKSLEDASSNLGSFLSGNYEAGESLGVFTSASQLAAWAAQQYGIDLNKVGELEKQQIRLAYWETVNKSSGAMGQAARESNSWANITANLTEVWRQFQAKVGAPVLEALTPVIQKITASFQAWMNSVDWEAFGVKIQTTFEKIYNTLSNLISFIVNHGAEIKGVIAGIAAAWLVIKGFGVISSITKLIGVIKSAGGVMAALNAIMAANPIGLIAIAIGVVVAAFVILWNKCEGFRNFWIGLWNGIKSGFEGVVNWFRTALTNIVGFFTGAVNGIKAAWSGVTGFFTGIRNGITNAFSTIGSWFSSTFTAARNGIQSAWSGVTSWFGGVKNGITSAFASVDSWMSSKFGAAWSAIKSVFSPFVAYFRQIWETVKGIFSVVGSVLKGDFSGAWEGIKSIFSGWGNFFKDRFSDIKNAFSGILSVGKNIIEGLWNGISSRVTWLRDKIRDWCNGIVDTIKSWFGIHSPSTLMRDQVGAMLARGMGEGVADNENAVLDPMDKLKDDVTNMNGLNVSRNISTTFGGPASSQASADSFGALASAILAKLDELKDFAVYLDKKALVGKLARDMDTALGEIAARKAVGAV